MHTIDLHELKPYGDTTNDGMIQLSFTLPVEPSDRAREAAIQLIRAMGFVEAKVAHMSTTGIGFSFFVVMVKTDKAVDFTKVDVPQHATEKRTYKEIDKLIGQNIKRPIRLVGACTGFDAHTVGLDAILNMKGFDGDIGLERYHGFRVVNMGSQVPTEDLIDRAVKEKADVILLSKVVSQKDIHIHDMRELIQKLEKRGFGDRFILVVGGPRVTHKMAVELGFDAGFTIGTKPSDVANYVYEKLVERLPEKRDEKPDGKTEVISKKQGKKRGVKE